MDELPEEEVQREGADSQEAPTGMREPTERIMEQDQGATETEMMRLAFERLKSRAADRQAGPPVAGRQSEASARPAQREEQTIIDGETAPGRQSGAPPDRSQPSHEPGGPAPEPDDVPSESEIRRAAYERLRAQAAEHDAIFPPLGASIEDDERAKRRQELEGALGEPVSPPQEDRGQLLGEGRDVPPSGPDDAPTEAEIRRAAFERLHAQAAEDEEVSPPRSKQRDEENERAKKIRDLETMIAERAALGPSDPTSESVIRREAFQRAREEVEEGGIPPPALHPEAAARRRRRAR